MTKKKDTLVPLKDTIASLLSDSILPFNPGGAHSRLERETDDREIEVFTEDLLIY